MNKTPIIHCVQNGDDTKFTDLIRTESNVRLLITKNLLLHVACRFGHLHLVKLLLQNGAPIDYKDPETERLALHDACVSGNWEIVELLCGLDKSLVDYTDKHNCTPAHVCAKEGELECLKVLVQHGCNLLCLDDNGFSVLHWAGKRNHCAIIRYLFDMDFNMNIESNDGRTTLNLACEMNSHEAVKCLLKCHCDPSISDRSRFHFTALHVAAKHNALECIRILVSQFGVPINSPLSDGRTPAHLAAQNGSYQCMHWLLNNGSNIDAVDQFNNTIGHSACQGGHSETIYCYLYHGGNKNVKNDLGENLHQIARRFGHPVKLEKAETGESSCPLCKLEESKRQRDQINAPSELVQAINHTQKSLFSNPLGSYQKLVNSHSKDYSVKKHETHMKYLETINIGKDQEMQQNIPKHIPKNKLPKNKQSYRDLVTRFYGEYAE